MFFSCFCETLFCPNTNPENSIEIKKDDEVDISLKVDRFDFSKLSLTARMIKPVDDEKNILIGCSFYSPNGELVAEIQSMLMHLDRIHRKKIYD